MKLFFSILAIFGFSQLLFAQLPQEELEISWRKRLAKGDLLMERASYYNAADYFESVVQERPDDFNAKFKLAMALYESRDYAGCETLFEDVATNKEKKYPEAKFYHGMSVMMQGDRYEEAEKIFKAARKIWPDQKSLDGLRMVKFIKNQQKRCDFVTGLDNQTVSLEVINPGENVNQPYTEFGPTILDEGRRLLFSSLREEEQIILNEENPQMPYAQLYETFVNDQTYTKAEKFQGPFNAPEVHTGNGSYSPDGKKFIFTKCTEEKGANLKCDIFISELDSTGKWQDPYPFEFNTEDYTETHPIITWNDDSTDIIYYSTDRPGGKGGLDIWFCSTRRGKLKNPKTCGSKINSVGDEITPFFDARDTVLYFASNGNKIGFGGFDIYKAKGSEKRFSVALALLPPINSPQDDFDYVHVDKENGYLVSNRPGTTALRNETCCDDIFRFQPKLPEGFNVMGFAYDKKTGEKLDGVSIEIKNTETMTQEGVSVATGDSMFNVFVPLEGAEYVVEGRAPGYVAGEIYANTEGLNPRTDTVFVDVYLTNINDFNKVVLRNVYFDYNKANILPESKASLDTIYNILNESPNLIIELSSHTDSRGRKSYNKLLSQRRAESSKQYLVDKGVEADRIIAIGYGEDELLNNCSDGVECTEIEHQVNRRTEFTVIGELDDALVIYDRREVEAIRKKKEKGDLTGNEVIWDVSDEEFEMMSDDELVRRALEAYKKK